MSQKYFGLVTDKGLSKLRAAAQGTGSLTLSHMAFGDGDGREPAPHVLSIGLVNERYRAPLSDKRPHETNPSILYVEAIIPPGVGGWTLREAGIYDSDGDLIVIAKTPAMDVALLSEGATTEGLVRLPIVFENAKSVEFLIDPTVLLATQSWVIERLSSRPFLTVESVSKTVPPTAPVNHDVYVVPANASGAWAGKDNLMAYWYGKWIFVPAPVSKVVGASDTGKYFKRTATGWVEFVAGETESGFIRLATDAEQAAGVIRGAANHPAGTALAVQSGKWNYVVAGGTADALTAPLNPNPSSIPNGMPIRVLIKETNKGPATLNGLPITTRLGNPLKQGDLPKGSIISMVRNNQTWALTSFANSEIPIIGSITLWVRPDGSDDNDGSANDPDHALRTIRAAWERLSLALPSARITIQLGVPGTYEAPNVLPTISCTVSIVGDPANQAGYIIKNDLDANAMAIYSATVTLSGFTISHSRSNRQNLAIGGGASATIGNITLSGTAYYTLTVSNGGSAVIDAPITIASGGTSGIYLLSGSMIVNANIIVSGNPYYAQAFMVATSVGTYTRGAAAMATVIGSAQGVRYIASQNGVIGTLGGGANYFPGTSAGVTGTGGQYS